MLNEIEIDHIIIIRFEERAGVWDVGSEVSEEGENSNTNSGGIRGGSSYNNGGFRVGGWVGISGVRVVNEIGDGGAEDGLSN